MSNGRESGGVFDLQRTGDTSTLFHPIKPKRAFDEISEEIKRLIFKGILKPGDRLPSETELAGRFGVGRQTIREALRLLELSGFISMQKGGVGGGPLVVDTILNTISNSFLDAFQMGQITIDELTLARLAIEKMVLESLVAHVAAADAEALRENICLAKKKIEAGRQAFEENTQFHRLLARASGNHLFVILTESIMTVVAHFRSILGVNLELSARCTAAHEQIIDALVKGNRKKAFVLLQAHLTEVGKRFQALADQLKREPEGR